MGKRSGQPTIEGGVCRRKESRKFSGRLVWDKEA